MATRFYLEASGTAAISPTQDAGWEDITALTRVPMSTNKLGTTIAGSAATITNGSIEDNLVRQCISDPLKYAQTITGTVSMVVSCLESSSSTVCTLSLVVRLLSNDGTVVRGTLFSNYSQDSTYDSAAGTTTRIVNAGAVTSTTAVAGDRIVAEIGTHNTNTIFSGTATQRFGSNNAADFALTSGLTTDLNPWLEFSQDLWPRLVGTKNLRPAIFTPGVAR